MTIDLLRIQRDPDDPRRKTFESVKTLTTGEEQAISDAIRHLREFETWDALIRNVEENHKAFQVAVAQCAAEAAHKGSIGELKPLADVTLNRELINVVASFKLVLDHSRTRLCNRFGKLSPEVRCHEATTSTAFDRSFGYRFVSQLRDYVAHCGFPIEDISIESSIGQTGRPVHQFSFTFNAKRLLDHGPTYWRGRVKADLMASKGPIAVEPVLLEAIGELRGICAALALAERPHLNSAAKIIWDLIGGVFAENTIAALGRIIPVDNEGVDLELLDLPARMLERLGYLHIER
jgi:hypothetical protein